MTKETDEKTRKANFAHRPGHSCCGCHCRLCLYLTYAVHELHPSGIIGNTDILALNNSPNSLCFIPPGDGYILIDAGSNADRAAQGLSEIGVNPQEVRHILLTHSDSDHVAALSLFPNAEIYMSGDEFQMINGTTRRNAFSSNSLPHGIDIEDTILLEKGQQFELGERFVSCITAPGHTPGSMAYLLDDQYLFTVDALRVKGSELLVHPYTTDSRETEGPIEKLSSFMEDPSIVLTAHYGWHDPAALNG